MEFGKKRKMWLSKYLVKYKYIYTSILEKSMYHKPTVLGGHSDKSPKYVSG